MTPEQVTLVQDSFKLVGPITEQAADIFYNRLFEIAPEVRPLFPEDMAEQKVKLFKMLSVAVNGLTNLDAILPAVKDLGARHGDYKVLPEHYDHVGAALLYTLGAGLGDAFTPEVEAAWTETYTTLATVMKDAQAEAAAA